MKYLNAAQRLEAKATELVFILIDYSPSMESDDYHPSRKAGAIEANQRLIECKAELFPEDQMGIIVFSGAAEVLYEPAAVGANKQVLCKSLQENKDLGCGTNFVAALELVERCLFGIQVHNATPGFFGRMLSEFFIEPGTAKLQRIRMSNVNGEVTRRIIMLTDGEHNRGGNAVKVANRLKDAGAIIECVGIAGSPAEVDEKMLKEIASIDEHGQPRYCFIGDTSQLIQKYESMANQIRPV